MITGIVGLGLIGGSLAKAIRANTENTVLGCDINESVVLKARVIEAIDDELTAERVGECDLLIIALYPAKTVEWVKSNCENIRKDAIVIDCCGVKSPVCAPLFPLAKEHGFTFVGAHPMAGLEFSGFEHSQGALFENASMILVPGPDTDIAALHTLKALFTRIGFSHIQMAGADEHDVIIACTSQLAHIVSSAYVKSGTASRFRGFSAGSFKDMTRVARLNPEMWTELFMDNRENLVREIAELSAHLEEYAAALQDCDRNAMYKLLEDGDRIKKSLSAD